MGERTTTKLSRDVIVDVAYRLIDEGGVDGFSIRALTRELGVSSMATYAYFPSKDEIVGAVCARYMRNVDTRPIPGERWDDTLRRTTRSINANALAHPNLERAMASATPWSDALREHTQKINALHEAQNIPPQVLSRLWAIVDAFLGGFLAAEVEMDRARQLPPEDCSGDWLKMAEKAYTLESFDNGIDIIIAGVYNIEAPDPCDWHTPYDASDTQGASVDGKSSADGKSSVEGKSSAEGRSSTEGKSGHHEG